MMVNGSQSTLKESLMKETSVEKGDRVENVPGGWGEREVVLRVYSQMEPVAKPWEGKDESLTTTHLEE